MKITHKTYTEEKLEARDYRDAVEIHIDGKRVFSVYDGELEDNSIGRNFNDVFKIPNLMKTAFNAGKNGEELEVEMLELDE